MVFQFVLYSINTSIVLAVVLTPSAYINICVIPLHFISRGERLPSQNQSNKLKVPRGKVVCLCSFFDFLRIFFGILAASMLYKPESKALVCWSISFVCRNFFLWKFEFGRRTRWYCHNCRTLTASSNLKLVLRSVTPFEPILMYHTCLNRTARI